MTSADDRREQVRRILVALTAISDSQAAIERAAALAAAFEAELAGLFVEDLNLLNAADLPGHEIVWTTGQARATSRAELERQLRERAERARQLMESIAGSRRLHWSFEVRRARLADALREATQAADVVTADWTGPGANLPPARFDRRPVLAYYEGGDCGPRVLAVAVRAAVERKVPLVVLVPARNAEVAATRVAEVRELLRSHDLFWRVERVPAGPAALQRRLRREPGQALMLDVAGRLVENNRLPLALGAGGCEIVLVSGRRAESQASRPST